MTGVTDEQLMLLLSLRISRPSRSSFCDIRALPGRQHTVFSATECPVKQLMGEAMKENIKMILVITSVALNLVFIVTYGIYKLSAQSNINPASSAGPVYLQLHLAPEQAARFEQEGQNCAQGLKSWDRQSRKNRAISLI